MANDPVDAILKFHGIHEPWHALPATGVASRIYATRNLVLKIATDHEDAIVDARTESVAAPAALLAGIRTPRLVAFSDSRTLVDRPYSIWERVHAETLGLAELSKDHLEAVWWQAGREIEQLHSRVLSCPDPNGYLDTPGREHDLDPALKLLADSGHADASTLREIELLIRRLSPYVSETTSQCFVHNDLHEMNILCTASGDLKAIIDWGDAGWGDPAFDFSAVPLDYISSAMAGYGTENLKRLGDAPQARFLWDRLQGAIDDLIETAESPIPIRSYWSYLDQV